MTGVQTCALPICIIDPGQSQITQLNEQAMSLKVTDLQSGDARAVYKNSGMDMRTFKRLQMFVHAEKLIDDKTNLRDGDVSVFLRLGSDSKSNYYEYEVPLSQTIPAARQTALPQLPPPNTTVHQAPSTLIHISSKYLRHQIGRASCRERV